MHIHGVTANGPTPNLHASANAARAAEAQRAAETRKRLLKNPQSVDGESSPESNLESSTEESRMIGRWLGADQHQGQGQQQNGHFGDEEGSGEGPDFE
jgi:hypothetical protein